MTFTLNHDRYLIIIHKNNKVSFFKNDKQFASLIKKTFEMAGQNRFDIKSDYDVNFGLLILFICVVVITIYDGPEETYFTFDLGGYFKELKPFDETWTPKTPMN